VKPSTLAYLIKVAQMKIKPIEQGGKIGVRLVDPMGGTCDELWVHRIDGTWVPDLGSGMDPTDAAGLVLHIHGIPDEINGNAGTGGRATA